MCGLLLFFNPLSYIKVLHLQNVHEMMTLRYSILKKKWVNSNSAGQEIITKYAQYHKFVQCSLFSWRLDEDLLLNIICYMGFPGGASGKESACQCSWCRRQQRCSFYPWIGKIPWGSKQQPSPVFLPGKFHRQRSLVGYSPWVAKSRTELSNWV